MSFISKESNQIVLFGLGNPGSRYELTRHNAAWLWLDEHFGPDDYQFNKYGNYDWKSISIDNQIFYLIKPRTFMNNSGEALKYLLDRKGVNLEDIVVIHDEVDLEVGDYKYSCNRGDGGHNGLRSINVTIGTNNYCRLRLGVRPIEVTPSVKADTYILSAFRSEELNKLYTVEKEVLLTEKPQL